MSRKRSCRPMEGMLLHLLPCSFCYTEGRRPTRPGNKICLKIGEKLLQDEQWRYLQRGDKTIEGKEQEK